MDQARVSQLMADFGIDWTTTTLDDIRVRYIRRLREQAAGRATNGDLDLATERARLASEQANRVAMINAVSRKELAPVALLEQSIARTGRQIAGVLESLPVQLRRRSPHLTAEDLSLIGEEIARARNLAANMELITDDDDGSVGDQPSDPLRPQDA